MPGFSNEDTPYHNCVFVGRDGSGQSKFASKRGTCDLGGSSFKRDVLGSDKKVGFRLTCDPEIEEVTVFEAPINLMSFCTLCPEVHSNAVALCGLYSGPLDTYLLYTMGDEDLLYKLFWNQCGATDRSRLGLRTLYHGGR